MHMLEPSLFFSSLKKAHSEHIPDRGVGGFLAGTNLPKGESPVV